ncbi:MAG: DUF167 domain-containing protein [Cystobacterineae bacterium]|nr:DUF167 domain-containing protein [Cystobacterineae bacterium]
MASKASKKNTATPDRSTRLVPFCQCPEGLLLFVALKPRASRNALLGIYNGKLKISLSAPPVDNQANEALCHWLAQAFGLSKSNIELLSGHNARHKKLLLRGPYAQLLERLHKLLSEKLEKT